MKNSVGKWFLATVASVGVTAVAGAVLSVPRVEALNDGDSVYYSTADDVMITLPVSCTMKGSVTSGHSRIVNSGQHESGIGSTTVTVYCNDGEGFDIYAMGASGGYEGNTNLISSVSSAYDIHTGVYDQEKSTNSSWSMLLSVAGGDYDPIPVEGMFGSYVEIPSAWTKIAYRDASAGTMSMDTTKGGSSFTTTYDVYANWLQPAGTYNGQVRYVMIHPSSPERETLTTLEDAFAGAHATKVTVDGRSYYRMQDMTSEICAAADVIGSGSQVQLVDIRNGNKIYWAAKLKDGNCWMTQNLDLDLADNIGLTSENSNITMYGTKGYDAENGYSCSGGSGDNCSGGVISWTPERSTYSSATAPGAENWAGDTKVDDTSGYYNPYSWDRLLTDDGGVVYPDSTVTQAVAGNHAMAGNYYNWSAAVASNNTYGVSGSQKNSICPKGWRLPVNGEYGTLYNTYKTSSHNYKAYGLMDDPLWLVRSGGVGGNGGLDYSGRYGDYWSSTVVSDTNSYYLYFYYDGVYPAVNYYRFYGFSVRCIAE